MCSHTYVFISSRPTPPPPSSVTIMKVPVFVSSYSDSSCFDYSHCCCGHGHDGYQGYGSYQDYGFSHDPYSNYRDYRHHHRPYTDAQFGVDLVCGSIAASGVAIADIIRAANGIEPKSGRNTESSQQSDGSQGSSNTSSTSSSTGTDNTRAKENAAALERNKQMQSEISSLSTELARLNQIVESLTKKDEDSKTSSTDSADKTDKTDNAGNGKSNTTLTENNTSSTVLTNETDNAEKGKSNAPKVADNTTLNSSNSLTAPAIESAESDGDDLDDLMKKAKSLNTDFTSVPEGKREIKNQIPTIKAYNKWAAAIVKHSGEELSDNVKKHVKEAIANLSYLVQNNAKVGDSAKDPDVIATVSEANNLLSKLKAMM